MQTNIPVGSPLAVKKFGAALFAATQRAPSLQSRLTGPAPKQSDAEAKLKGQTSPDMPFVRVTDLSRSQGDTVSVDLINITGGKPLMGDRMAEGKGEKLSFSSMDIRIDLATKVVDAGGKMAQQRTLHNLRSLSMANLANWFVRYGDQSSLVHIAGARGVQAGLDWVVPLASDPDFADIMVNTVRAPTFNRHFVADGANLLSGGSGLSAIDSTDVLRLEHLDAIATIIDEMEFKLQPVKIVDDPARDDAPIYVLLVSPRHWHALQTSTNTVSWRNAVQAAWERKNYGSKHPLFNGDMILWRGILVRKHDRAIRHLAGSSVNICANVNSATESSVTVNAGLGANAAVDRALLLGAQAMAHVYGRNQASETYGSWMEREYNFKRNLEVAGDVMCGKSKIRFDLPGANGTTTPTDHGVIAIDTAVAL